MKPIVDRLETQFAGQIAFQRVKTDEGDGPALTRAYRIQGHPTFLIIDPQGQELNRLIGPQSAEQLTAAIQQVLALTAGQQGAAAPSATLPPLPALGAGEVALMFKLNLKRWVALVGLVALTGVLLGSLFAGTAPAQGPASQQSPSTGSGSGSTNGS